MQETNSTCMNAGNFLYFSPCLSYMGAASERKKRVTSFADVADRVGRPASYMQGYNQLGFEGLETTETKEVTIENLAVAKLPLVKKVQDRIEWSCHVSYQPDLWHQEGYSEFVLHATQNAEAAIALRLKPRDLVQVTGVSWDQRVDLRGGKTKIIHHLIVTDMAIMKRAPAQSSRRRNT